MKTRVNTVLQWMLIASVSSHIFCCVLPSVLSVLSLATGLGMVSTMFPALDHVHEALHQFHVPILVFAAVMLVLGWGIQLYSQKIDCHDTGCAHGPCTPKKKRSALLLYVATALFVFNLATLPFIDHEAAAPSYRHAAHVTALPQQ